MNADARYRTIWLSDVHLGSRVCRAELLLDFLQHHDSEVLYLVGDIIDLERMRRSFYWPATHTEILRAILDKSRRGTRVIYVPGNHDDDFRALVGSRFGNIEIARRSIHTTRKGKRLLVLHGDEFDAVIRCSKLTSLAGSLAYGALLSLNRLAHWYHDLLGKPYWSLAQHVKQRLGNAVRYVQNFQRACIAAARDGDFDGIVCGHIHRADVVTVDGITYYNDGDWVESCTALTEDQQGNMNLRAWTAQAAREPSYAAELPDAA